MTPPQDNTPLAIRTQMALTQSKISRLKKLREKSSALTFGTNPDTLEGRSEGKRLRFMELQNLERYQKILREKSENALTDFPVFILQKKATAPDTPAGIQYIPQVITCHPKENTFIENALTEYFDGALLINAEDKTCLQSYAQRFEKALQIQAGYTKQQSAYMCAPPVERLVGCYDGLALTTSDYISGDKPITPASSEAVAKFIILQERCRQYQTDFYGALSFPGGDTLNIKIWNTFCPTIPKHEKYISLYNPFWQEGCSFKPNPQNPDSVLMEYTKNNDSEIREIQFEKAEEIFSTYLLSQHNISRSKKAVKENGLTTKLLLQRQEEKNLETTNSR